MSAPPRLIDASRLSWYESDETWTPLDLVPLQFVTISTRGINFHQFSFVLETPLRQLELHAASQDELERWTDAILAAQESHSRSAHGYAGRRTSVLQRVLRKGRSSVSEMRPGRYSRVTQSDASACVALRGGADVGISSRSASGGGDGPGELDAIGVVPEAEIDLSSVMANAHLRGLLAEFATEHGADAEFKLLEETNTAASQRVEADLLPQFCQSEGFLQWLAEQQAADELAVSLAALVRQPAALQAFRDNGLGDAVLSENHYDLAFVELVERIHTQPLPVTELLKIARQAIATHLEPGSPKLVAISSHIKDEIDAAMATLEASGGGGGTIAVDGSSRLLVAFISAQLEASQRLSELLRRFEASAGSGDAWRQVQEAELDADCCTHWIYCKAGFNAFRAWLVEAHAVRCSCPTHVPVLDTTIPLH